MPKPDKKFDQSDKKSHELVRRWLVHIYQIEVTNLSGRIFDPFVQLIIGGDYYVEINKTSSGKSQHNHHGERGVIYQSDVLRFVQPNEG